jgi:GPH family glycoside/pentoside/hexuronide:cation symporter
MGSGATNLQTGWQLTALTFGLLAIIFFLITFSFTKERISPISKKTSLKNDLKDLFQNRPWFILLGAGVAAIFFNALRDGATIYYFKYYVLEQGAFSVDAFKLTITYSSLYFVLGQAANIIGVLLAKPISDKIGKKYTFLYAMIFASLLSVLFFWIDKSSLSLIFLAQFFISICAGIIFPLVWSMYADTADYSEWKTGRRATGLIFSASSMSQKFGWTIGGALTGWLLGYYGFRANVVQSEGAQIGIRLMLSIFPAIGTCIAALFMLLYPLKESVMYNIEAELENRRKSIKNRKEG